MSDLPREFRITAPLPLSGVTGVEQAQVVRLCVFMNVLQTIYHLALAAQERTADDRFGAFMRAGHELVTTLLLMGVLKEGADAMRDFASQIDKVVGGLPKGPVDAKPIAEAWTRLKAAISKDNPTSLWNRHLSHARDKAAFHWARGEIEKACSGETGTKAPYLVFCQTGDPIGFVRYTLADEMLGRVAFPDVAKQGDIQEAVIETRGFATDVIRVLSTVLPAYIREHGGKLQPFDGL